MNANTSIPTVVFIPGLLSDSIVWQPIGDSLQEALPVHYADISTMTSIGGAAKQLLNQISGSLVVAGHSLGGRIALEMYQQAPERIKGLLLADTGTHPRKEGESNSRQTMIDLANNEGMQRLAEQWLPPMVHPSRHDADPLMKALNSMVLRATEQQHERQMNALLNRPNAQVVLCKISCPALLLVGRQDLWSPVEQHEAMCSEIDNAELAIIEDAGHFAPIERIEETSLAFTQWLKKHFKLD